MPQRTEPVKLGHYQPADEVRASLKKHGFRWSPTIGAWRLTCSTRELSRLIHAKRVRIDPSFRGELIRLFDNPKARMAYFSKHGLSIDDLGKAIQPGTSVRCRGAELAGYSVRGGRSVRRFLLEFRTDTNAFKATHATPNDDFRAELKESAKALRYVAKGVADGAIRGDVLDSNGVTVGAWRMVR